LRLGIERMAIIIIMCDLPCRHGRPSVDRRIPAASSSMQR
jgi:hypothetical protein